MNGSYEYEIACITKISWESEWSPSAPQIRAIVRTMVMFRVWVRAKVRFQATVTVNIMVYISLSESLPPRLGLYLRLMLSESLPNASCYWGA